MNHEEIIAMAKEAGFPFNKYGLLQGDDDGEIDADAAFASFAALVAAKEREACAKVCGRMAQDAALSNRRRCDADALARSIRARGQKEGA